MPWKAFPSSRQRFNFPSSRQRFIKRLHFQLPPCHALISKCLATIISSFIDSTLLCTNFKQVRLECTVLTLIHFLFRAYREAKPNNSPDCIELNFLLPAPTEHSHSPTLHPHPLMHSYSFLLMKVKPGLSCINCLTSLAFTDLPFPPLFSIQQLENTFPVHPPCHNQRYNNIHSALLHYTQREKREQDTQNSFLGYCDLRKFKKHFSIPTIPQNLGKITSETLLATVKWVFFK